LKYVLVYVKYHQSKVINRSSEIRKRFAISDCWFATGDLKYVLVYVKHHQSKVINRSSEIKKMIGDY